MACGRVRVRGSCRRCLRDLARSAGREGPLGHVLCESQLTIPTWPPSGSHQPQDEQASAETAQLSADIGEDLREDPCSAIALFFIFVV